MSEMIERVARAMCKEAEERVTALNGEPGWQTLGYESQDVWIEEHWPNFVDQARVAIGAMREPTPTMLEHGLVAIGINGNDPTEDELALAWYAMIDAANPQDPEPPPS